MRITDLSNQRIGRLVALTRTAAVKPSGQKYSLWKCRCDCGNTTSVRLGDLRSGNTKSCGCLNLDLVKIRSITHGMSHSNCAAYSVWNGMRTRCLNKTDKGYKYYGGRGITICERWMEFENFYKDMGDSPPGMQIERKDNDKGYSPDNCVWAAAAVQARNRRSNVMVTIGDRRQCLLDWCLELSLNYHRVRARIKKLGWSLSDALEVENAR